MVNMSYRKDIHFMWLMCYEPIMQKRYRELSENYNELG